MLKISWLEMKNYLKGNKRIFLLSVFAFVCSCVAINLTVWNYMEANAEQKAYEESYSDKVFYKIDLQGETEIYQRIFGGDNIKQVKKAFEQLKSDPLFQYRYRSTDGIGFFAPSESSDGASIFPSYKDEFLTGYEDGSASYSNTKDYLNLKALYADRLFINEPHVHLDSGEWFSDESFCVNDLSDIHLSVVLGAHYRDLYEIGDTIANAHYGSDNPITLHIAGFLEEDSWYYDNNNTKQILNRYIVIPSPEAVNEQYPEDGSYDGFVRACYDANKIVNTRIVCSKEDAEAVEKRVYQIFNDNGLHELKLRNETDGAQKGLEQFKSLNVSSMAISIFTLLLSVLMFSIQAHYKLSKYKKKYGIYMMSGITSKQLIMIMVLDTMLIFALANIFTILAHVMIGFITVTLSVHTVIVIVALEFFLLCFMGLSGYKKVHQIDMSSALREHE